MIPIKGNDRFYLFFGNQHFLGPFVNTKGNGMLCKHPFAFCFTLNVLMSDFVLKVYVKSIYVFVDKMHKNLLVYALRTKLEIHKTWYIV